MSKYQGSSTRYNRYNKKRQSEDPYKFLKKYLKDYLGKYETNSSRYRSRTGGGSSSPYRSRPINEHQPAYTVKPRTDYNSKSKASMSGMLTRKSEPVYKFPEKTVTLDEKDMERAVNRALQSQEERFVELMRERMDEVFNQLAAGMDVGELSQSDIEKIEREKNQNQHEVGLESSDQQNSKNLAELDLESRRLVIKEIAALREMMIAEAKKDEEKSNEQIELSSSSDETQTKDISAVELDNEKSNQNENQSELSDKQELEDLVKPDEISGEELRHDSAFPRNMEEIVEEYDDIDLMDLDEETRGQIIDEMIDASIIERSNTESIIDHSEPSEHIDLKYFDDEPHIQNNLVEIDNTVTPDILSEPDPAIDAFNEFKENMNTFETELHYVPAEPYQAQLTELFGEYVHADNIVQNFTETLDNMEPIEPFEVNEYNDVEETG